MSEPYERARATVRAPNYFWVWAFLAFCALFAIAGFALHLPGNLPAMPFYMSGLVIAAVQRNMRPRQAALRADDSGVTLDGKLKLARGKVQQALVWHEKDATWVRLSGRSLLDVQVRDDDEAQELLRALKLDARSTTTTFNFQGQKGSQKILLASLVLFAMLVGAAFAFAGPHAALLLPFLLGSVVLFTVGIVVAVRAASARLVVGADGVVVRDGLERAKFYKHDEIRAVTASGLELKLETSDGKARVFQNGRPGKKDRERFEIATAAIAGRVRDARAAYLEDRGSGVIPALERGAHDPKAWLEALRKLGAGAESAFRDGYVTRERLWKIVESTSAPFAQRVAATIALRAQLEESERPRLRVLVDQCAREEHKKQLRVAIEETDEDKLTEALAQSAEM